MIDIAIALAFFLFVMGVVVAVGYVFLQPDTEPAGAGAPSAAAVSGDPGGGGSTVGRAFISIGGWVPAASRPGNPLRKSLAAAGYHHPSALTAFYGVRCASAIAGAAIVTVLGMLIGNGTSGVFTPLVSGAAIGYFVPARILRSLTVARATRLRRALPTALDLCVLSLEAGQSLDQAILDTSRGLRRSYPDLAGELYLVFIETRASNDRGEALRNLGERTGEPEVRKVAVLLGDADRFGASIAPALRNHARHLRNRMRQRAQEASRKVSVKLVFPVFFLIFPSVLLVTLGPACIMVMTQLRSVLK